MNTYRATSPYGLAVYGEGVFEQDFPAGEEGDLISARHIEIEPRSYRVLSRNFTAGKRGATVPLALLADHESALIQGGHIERVDDSAPSKKKG